MRLHPLKSVGLEIAPFGGMGRPPRIQSADLHYHVIARCNNGAFHFQTDEDFRRYLDVLRFFKKKHGFEIFDYELMSNHVHLFMKPSSIIPLHKTMLLINWKYASDYNRSKGRKGHFWLDRYKSLPVESDEHALDLMRYINRNSLRAGLVSRLGEWKWSGFRSYALGEWNDLITPHPSYLALGPDDKTRRRLFIQYVSTVIPAQESRRLELSDGPYIGSLRFGRELGLAK